MINAVRVLKKDSIIFSCKPRSLYVTQEHKTKTTIHRFCTVIHVWHLSVALKTI